ncbi:MAG TPA: CBS domain-containing protein [Micromonosporaceae bacterium]
MRARDLATDMPTVTLLTPALEASRLLAEQNLPGLIVLDEQRRPWTVLPGTQVLRLAVPQYCQDDPALARVVDEQHADLFLEALDAKTVRELLPEKPRELPVVDGDATVLEVAAVMARMRSPVVAVMEEDRMVGAITLDNLLDRMLPA